MKEALDRITRTIQVIDDVKVDLEKALARAQEKLQAVSDPAIASSTIRGTKRRPRQPTNGQELPA